MLFTKLIKKVFKEKTYSYTLDIGLNDKNTLKQEITTNEAIEIIKNHTLNICGGYTMRENNGGYIMDSGEKVQEKSIQVNIMFSTRQQINELIDILKVELNQEAIGLKIEEITYCYA